MKYLQPRHASIGDALMFATPWVFLGFMMNQYGGFVLFIILLAIALAVSIFIFAAVYVVDGKPAAEEQS